MKKFQTFKDSKKRLQTAKFLKWIKHIAAQTKRFTNPMEQISVIIKECDTLAN